VDTAAIATPAATIIVFREQPAAPPALLMVERSARMAFAAGAAVFPGGRVDPDDDALAADLAAPAGLDLVDAAARIAAIRETLEETGLGIGFAEPPPAVPLTAARAQLHAGAPLSAVLAEQGWQLDLGALTPFTRWRPPFREPRVFDTRFYIARCAGADHAISVDATENHRLFWAGAAEVLARADAGSVKIIFPTRRNLERLAQFASFADALADAAAHPAQLIVPFIEARDGVDHLCIPDGIGYPVTSEPIGHALRG